MFASLLLDIYLRMLDKIAQTKEAQLPEGEKIEMKVDLLNILTLNKRYIFESIFKSKNEKQTP